MIHQNQEYKHPTNNILSVLVGTLIGGMLGALTIMLLAPQSGKETRSQIQKKGMELRHRANKMMEDAMKQVRTKANKITMSIKNSEQLEHLSEAA